MLPNNNATAAKMLLTALAAGKYVDPRTRLLMVEVTMFNPNLDMWVQYDFTVESPKAGGFRTSASFNTVKLYSMFEDTRTWAIVLEVRCRRSVGLGRSVAGADFAVPCPTVARSLCACLWQGT